MFQVRLGTYLLTTVQRYYPTYFYGGIIVKDNVISSDLRMHKLKTNYKLEVSVQQYLVVMIQLLFFMTHKFNQKKNN